MKNSGIIATIFLETTTSNIQFSPLDNNNPKIHIDKHLPNKKYHERQKIRRKGP